MSDHWQETLSFAKNIRRELHQRPELSWEEHATAEKIRTVLTDLGIRWKKCATTGTVAVLNEQGSTPAIALRAESSFASMKSFSILEITSFFCRKQSMVEALERRT